VAARHRGERHGPTGGDRLEAAAFRNPDGSVAAVALNRTEEEIPFVLRTPRGTASVAMPARSIRTFLYGA
jgi:glucosylceramidase